MQPYKTYTIEEAKAKLEYYCAYQERCHKDVREKLRGMRMIPEAIDQILVHLIENNYLNEGRFAEQYAIGKFRIKYWGKQRIKRELQFREISNYAIDKALKEISEKDYFETLYRLAEKRINQVKEHHPQKRKKKICDYLLYRGWEPHLVYEAVNSLLTTTD